MLVPWTWHLTHPTLKNGMWLVQETKFSSSDVVSFSFFRSFFHLFMKLFRKRYFLSTYPLTRFFCFQYQLKITGCLLPLSTGANSSFTIQWLNLPPAAGCRVAGSMCPAGARPGACSPRSQQPHSTGPPAGARASMGKPPLSMNGMLSNRSQMASPRFIRWCLFLGPAVGRLVDPPKLAGSSSLSDASD